MTDEVVPVVRRLLPEALGFLERLVAVNSFTANAAGVRHNADLVAGQFAGLGFSAEHVPSANPAWGDHLFLRRPGSGSAGVLLVTHLDTVYPPEEEDREDFHWEPAGEKIFGPGTNDNKGGTAMIWLVLAALREVAPEVFARTHWLVAANAAEEELAPDFPAACRDRLPPGCRAALVFEACTGQGRGFTLVRCRKGSANLRVTAHGRGAHAGSRHAEGANAIVELSHWITRLAARTDPARALTVNVGAVHGGGPTNRVPHEASCEVNVRAFDPAVLDAAVEEIRSWESAPPAVRAVSDGFPCRWTVEVLSRNPAWPENPPTDALIAHWQAAAASLAVDLLVEPRGGLSDGNYLAQFLPVLDGLGPFGLNGHVSERSADGTKEPESVRPESFVPMGAVTVTALRGLLA